MAISRSKVEIWQRALDRIGQTSKIEDENDPSTGAEVCRRHFDDIVIEVLERFPWAWAKRQAALLSVETQQTVYTYAAVSATDFEIPFAFGDAGQVSVTKGGATLAQGSGYAVVAADPAAAAPAKVVLVVALTAGQSITITVASSREGFDHIYGLPADCVTPLALVAEDARYSLLAVDARLEFEIMANDAGTGRLVCTDLVQGTDFEVLEYIAVSDYVPAWPRQFADCVAWRLAKELADALTKDQNRAIRCAKEYERSIDLARVGHLNTGTFVAPETPSIAARGIGFGRGSGFGTR